MKKMDRRNVLIALLIVTNLATLALLRPKSAEAGFDLGGVGKLFGIIDLEHRLRADGTALVGDAKELRVRAVALKNELEQTNQRLGLTDADLAHLNQHLDELRGYSDTIHKVTGR